MCLLKITFSLILPSVDMAGFSCIMQYRMSLMTINVKSNETFKQGGIMLMSLLKGHHIHYGQ